MNEPTEIGLLRAEALQLAGSVEKYAVDVLEQQVREQHEGQRIVLLALAVRMLQTYRAVLNLMGECLHDGAGAVLRSLLEQHFVFVALLKDPELFRLANKQEQGEQKKALRGLKKLAPGWRPEYLTDEALEVEIASRDPSGFEVWKWAHEAGLEDSYHTLYRLLSVNAHGALHALNDYLIVSDDGIVLGIRSRILPVRATDFVVASVGILMNAVGSIDNQPMTEARRARREQLGSELESLRDRHYEIVEKICPTDDAA